MTAAVVSALLAVAGVLLALRGAPTPSRARPRAGPRPAPSVHRLPVLAGLGAGLGTMLFVGGLVGAGAGVVAGTVVGLWVRRLEPPAAQRRREALEQGMPLAVDLLASCLAVGQAPGTALDEVARVLRGPLAEELGTLSSRLHLGAEPVTVWRDVAGHPQLGGMGRTVLRAVDGGSSVAEAMAAHADDLRRAARSRVEAQARAVGVRAALPLGLCLLPAFVLLGVVPLVAGSLSVVTLP